MYARSLKKLLVIVTISILTVIFSSPLLYAQRKVSEKNKYGGTLVIAVPLDARSLDSRQFTSNADFHFGFEKIYDRLVDYSEGGIKDVVPVLAESWKQTDDITWLVHIRKGVKFHNGKELTAEDVWKNLDWRLNSEKYSKEKGWKPPRGKTRLVAIKSVEIVDKYTLKFILKAPNVTFVNVILNWSVQGVVDPDIVEKYGKEATLHPVGTGPFKFVEWVSGDHITLQRFDDAWVGKPYLDKVIFRVIPDGQTRLIALQRGEVDAAKTLPLSSLPLIKKDSGLGYFLLEDITRISGVLWFNLRRWPMNQLKFRQAVAMGADWVKITKAAFPEGTAILCRSFLKGSWAENPEAEKLLPPYNPQRGKELVRELEKEAGRPLPQKIDVVVEREEILYGVLQMAAEQLKKIGVNLEIRALESAVAVDAVNQEPTVKWDITLFSAKGPGNDPSDTAGEFDSKTPRAGDRKNRAGYVNPEIDKLLEKASAMANRNERKKLYQQIEKIIFKDLPAMPIFTIPRLFAYNKKVHDLRAHNSSFLYLKTPWNNVWTEKK